MGRARSGRTIARGLGLILVGVAAAGAVASAARGADRCVLGEFFTWSGCYSCAEARQIVSGMISQYGVEGSIDPGLLAIVEIPVWDEYEEPWGADRTVFYGPIFEGTPSLVLDGLIPVGWEGDYQDEFAHRLAKPTSVTMSLEVTERAIDDYEVRVQVCLEPDAESRALRVYAVMVEDHYPPGVSDSRNTYRAAAPTVDVAVDPGACQTVTTTLQVAAATVPSNFRVVAWAQDAAEGWPAEVHQAAVAAWPFASPCPGDVDGTGDVGFGDLLAILSGWGTCLGCPEDVDGSGAVEFLDLLFVLSNWGACP